MFNIRERAEERVITQGVRLIRVLPKLQQWARRAKQRIALRKGKGTLEEITIAKSTGIRVNTEVN